MLDGKKKGDNLLFAVSGEKFIALEVGTFFARRDPREALASGEIGYIVTGIKKPGIASVGDTITKLANPVPPDPGYEQPLPMVWASVFPEDADDFTELKFRARQASAFGFIFSYEEESLGSSARVSAADF